MPVCARYRPQILLVATLATAAALALVQAGPQARASARQPNPDALVGSTVAANCGNGIEAIGIRLPARFNPLTATDAELIANDLPIRPTSSSDVATWRKFVTGGVKSESSSCAFVRGHAGVARPGLASGAAHAPVSWSASGQLAASNWAGDLVGRHIYHDIYGYWHVPNVGAHRPPRRLRPRVGWSSQWVGIGLGRSRRLPLAQAGSEADVTASRSSYHLWWQVYPDVRFQRYVGGTAVHPGDLIYAHVHLSRNDAVMEIKDLRTGAGGTFRFIPRRGSSIAADGTAEWVLERTERVVPGPPVYPALAESSTTFTSAEAAAAGVSRRGVGSLPHLAIIMLTCARPHERLAVPGRIAANHTSFAILWKNWGHADKAGCRPVWVP
jgi:hypothetical protein